MKTICGGSSVKGGYYWNTKKWEVVPVQGEAGVLPGRASDSFVKVSVPVLLVLAPAIGGAYALFLPFIGFAMAAWALGRKIGLVGSMAVDEAAATMSPAWRPGEAYFAGKAEEAKDRKAPVQSRELEELAAEVEAKKGQAQKKD